LPCLKFGWTMSKTATVTSGALSWLKLAHPGLEAPDLLTAVCKTACFALWALSGFKLAHPRPKALHFGPAMRKSAVFAVGAGPLHGE